MLFWKKLLTELLLAGSCAAFAACAPAGPAVSDPPEDPDEGKGNLLGYYKLPQEFDFRGVHYEIGNEVRWHDLVLTEDVIGMCIRAEDYEKYREKYPAMEFWVDAENKMSNNYCGDKFYICSVENYPVEQCVVLWDDRQACGIFVSDLFVMEEEV